MERIITALLVLVGAINFYPIVGVLSAKMLSNLYLIDVQSNDLLILLKHRAILFGLLGGFIIYSAFKPELQWLAIIMGLVSMLSFIVIAFLIGDYGAGIRKVIIADVIASAVLLVVLGLRWYLPR
jgi:hypothetical protein